MSDIAQLVWRAKYDESHFYDNQPFVPVLLVYFQKKS